MNSEGEEEESKSNDVLTEEYKRKIIESNFDIMNGHTINVIVDKSLIPKYFIPMNNLEDMKQAVVEDMEGNNLTALLN